MQNTTTQSERLIAFLLWNVLSNSTRRLLGVKVSTFRRMWAYWLATIERYQSTIVPSSIPGFSSLTNASSVAGTAIEVIIGFILAMIATLIGANLIGPVATAVGGALKNGNLTGAANSLTAQITLIFVTLVIVGVVIFLAVLGKKAESEAPSS